MSSYISYDLRHLVASRADHLCEYCLIHEDDTFFGCQVDHTISLKHGGPTEPNNLAYACAFCNRRKGSDIASIGAETGNLVRLYNPRIDKWADHFRLKGSIIDPLTEIGEVTARILGFNSKDRILERETLVKAGRCPTKGWTGARATSFVCIPECRRPRPVNPSVRPLASKLQDLYHSVCT